MSDDARALPSGKTCGDCRHFDRCKVGIKAESNWTQCNWTPSVFAPLFVQEDLGSYYRYEMVVCNESYYDDWGKKWFTHVRLHLSEHRVLKKTPQGVWVNYWGHHHDRKFVLTKARKKWACPSKEEALESFIARKKRQADHLERELAEVNEALEVANKTMKEKVNGELLHHCNPQEGGVSRDLEGDAPQSAADV